MIDFRRFISQFLMIFLCGMVAMGVLYYFFLYPSTEEIPAAQTETADPSDAHTEETTDTVSLYMLGDAMAQTPNVADASRDDGTYDFAPQMDGICDIAANYDLAFYNNECILGGEELGITPFPHFNCVYEFGDYMVSKGFNLVSVANNHALDKGVEGVENSCAYWNSQPDVITSGLYLSEEDSKAVNVFEKNNITFAFTAWTYGMNGNVPPEGRNYMVNKYRGRENELLEWIRSAKQQADFVIVSVHWGTEYTHEPDSEQLALAQKMADAGADLIIGNHAHNAQPIQWLNDHSTLCYYGLGNCLSAMDVPDVTTFEELNTDIVSSLNFRKTTRQDGTIEKEITDVRADLAFTYNTEGYTHMFAAMYTDLPDNAINNKDHWYQWHIDNVIHRYESDIEIGLETPHTEEQ